MPKPDYRIMTPDQLSAATKEIISRAESGLEAILTNPKQELTAGAISTFTSDVLQLRYLAVRSELFPANELDTVCKKIREDVMAGRPQAEIEADAANADPRIRPFIGMFVTAVQEDMNAAEESRSLIRLSLQGKEFPDLNLEQVAANCKKLGLKADAPTAKSISRRKKALSHMIDRAMQEGDAFSTTLPRWANNLLKKPGLSPEARQQIIDDFNSGPEGQQRVFDYCLGELLYINPEIFNLKTLDDYLDHPAQVDYYSIVGWDLEHTLTDAKTRGLTIDPQKAALATKISDQMSSYNNHFSFGLEAAANPISVIFPDLIDDPNTIDRLLSTAKPYTFEHRFALTAFQAASIKLDDPSPVLAELAKQSEFSDLQEYFTEPTTALNTLDSCALHALRKNISKELYLRDTDLLVKTVQIPQTAEELNQKLADFGDKHQFRTLSAEEKQQRMANRRTALENARELAWDNAQIGKMNFEGKDLVISVREYDRLIYRHDKTIEENQEILERYSAGDKQTKAEIIEECLRHQLNLIGNPDDYRQPISDEDLAVLWPPLSVAAQSLMQEYDAAMKTWSANGILINPALEKEVLRVKKAMEPVLQHYDSRFKLMTSSYYTELDEKELVQDDIGMQLSNALENSGAINTELAKIAGVTNTMVDSESLLEGEYFLNTLPPELASPDAIYGLNGKEASPQKAADVSAVAADGIILVWKEGMEYPAAFTVEKSVFPPQTTRIPYEQYASFVEGKIQSVDFSIIPDQQIDFAQAALSAYLDVRGKIAEKQVQLNAAHEQERQTTAAERKSAADAQAAREAELGSLAAKYTAANVAKGLIKDDAKERLAARIKSQQTYLGLTLHNVSELTREEFGNRLRLSLSIIMASKLAHDKLDTVYLTSSEQALREISDEKKIEAAAEQMRKSPMFNRFLNELSTQDLRNLSIDPDGKPVMENALTVYNERFTQAVISIKKHEANRSADFWKIRKEAKAKTDATEEFLDAVEARSAYARYNQNRLDDKQVLSDMLLVYSPFAARDPKLSPIMDKLKLLAEDNSTATTGNYWQESSRFLDVIAELQKYEADLDKQEEALAAESRKLFKKEDGSWMTDAELRSSDTDPALREKNQKQIRKSEVIDNRRRICADLRNYLECQRDGRLNEVTVDRSGKVIERDDIFDGTNVKMNYVLKSEGKAAKVATSVIWQMQPTNAPLFPHEPCMQDIAQGALGDCYYLASLSNIVRLHPEKIKEAIQENPDGKTVTVRLFARNEDGKMKPNYIVVDKVVPKSFALVEEGGVNCLWVNCFERALAISGLNRSPNNEMVPKDIKERAEALAHKKTYTDKDKLDNPWLFNGNSFIGWPAYESINGGNAGRISEVLLGPGYEPLNVQMEDNNSINRIYTNYKLTDPATLYELTFREEELRSNVPGKKMDLELTGNYEKGKNAMIRAVIGKKVPTPEQKQQIDDAFKLFDREFARLFPKGTKMDSENLMELQDELGCCEERLTLSDEGILIYSMLQSSLKKVITQSDLYNVTEDNIFQVIQEGRTKGLYMSAGSTDGERKTGVFDSHAYSVLGAYENPETGLRYVRLRNPWGNRIGLIRTIAGPKNAMLSTLDENGQVKTVQGTQEEGVFDMELHDFIHDFDHLQINGLELHRDSLATGKDDPDAFWEFKKAKDQNYLRKTFLCCAFDSLTDSEGELEKIWADDITEKQWLDAAENALKNNMLELDGADAATKALILETKLNAAKTIWQKCNETMAMAAGLDPKLSDIEFLETVGKSVKDMMNNAEMTVNGPFSTTSNRFIDMAKSIRNAEDVYQKLVDVMEKKDGTRIFLCKEQNSVANSYDGYVEVIGICVDADGKKALKVRDNTEHELALSSLVHEFAKISFEKPAPELAPVQARTKNPDIVDYKTMSNYLRTVTDYYQALCATDHCMSHDSTEYKELKECLKEVSLEIVHTRGKSFDRLIDAMRPLEEKCLNYRLHCEKEPKKASNWRRNTRVDIVKALDQMTAAAHEKKDNPRLAVQREIAGKMIEDALQTRGRSMPQKDIDAAADKLVANKFFSGKIDRENLFSLQKATKEQVHKLNLSLEGQNPKMVTEKETNVLNVDRHAANRIL